jgi:glucose-6-phosphate isomerase
MNTSLFVRPEQRQAWQQLQTLAQAPAVHLRDLLPQPGRSHGLQYQAAGLSLDASHQRVNANILSALHALAEESQVLDKAQAMFRGEHINRTEDRAVLHVALRGRAQSTPPWGAEISQAVSAELTRYTAFAQALRHRQITGHTGEPITDVVNLGIGGSDLGPRMATEALWPSDDGFHPPPVQVHYVSNVDIWQLAKTLSALHPARTLFVVQSKTFTTQETLTLFASAKRWLVDGGCPADQCHQHLVAVTAKPALAQSLGFHAERCFHLWDWVGGRYSLWSAIGLPLVVAIGTDAYLQMLDGAHAMDQHFLHTAVADNMPLMMAMFGIWNRNFLGATTHHIAPYHSALGKLVAFLQQQDMESNGKRVHTDGSVCAVATAPVLWGGLGNDGQHAYFQLLHQGSHLVPVDFIGVRHGYAGMPLSAEHQRVVLLNMQAQAQALALGRTPEDTLQQLVADGLSLEQARALAPHRSFAGNVPSSTLWMDQLTPYALGALIALYEHKVFCQAAVWGIHAYDQWGVELGKTMALALEKQNGGAGN